MNRRSYLDALTGQIRCGRARRAVRAELEEHIEEQKADFLVAGMTDEEAETASVLEMGDPVQVGREMNRIHRQQTDFRLVGCVIGMSGLGLSVQILIGKLIGAGAPEMLDTAAYLRETALWMAAGALLMTVLCRLDYMLLSRYAPWLWGGLTLVLAGAGLLSGGGAYPAQYPVWGNLLLCLMVPVFAGVVAHYRGRGTAGLARGILCFYVTVLVGLRLSSTVHTALFSLCGIVILAAAAAKGWFGQRRGHVMAGALGAAVGVPALGIGACLLSGRMLLARYQADRLRAVLHPDDGAAHYIFGVIEQAAKVVRGESPASVLREQGLLFAEVRSDFIWNFIYKCTAGWQFALITALVLVFLVLLVRTCLRQRNPFGSLLALAVTLMITLETGLYVAMNFGYFPVTSLYMPFFTGGKVNMVVTYFYMGLLLSVSRNERIAEV